VASASDTTPTATDFPRGYQVTVSNDSPVVLDNLKFIP